MLCVKIYFLEIGEGEFIASPLKASFNISYTEQKQMVTQSV